MPWCKNINLWHLSHYDLSCLFCILHMHASMSISWFWFQEFHSMHNLIIADILSDLLKTWGSIITKKHSEISVIWTKYILAIFKFHAFDLISLTFIYRKHNENCIFHCLLCYKHFFLVSVIRRITIFKTFQWLREFLCLLFILLSCLLVNK